MSPWGFWHVPKQMFLKRNKKTIYKDTISLFTQAKIHCWINYGKETVNILVLTPFLNLYYRKYEKDFLCWKSAGNVKPIFCDDDDEFR